MSSLLDAIQRSLDTPDIYPGGEGRGIVIVGGGIYLPSAYIAIRHLRAHGCALPVQLWHLGKDEVPQFFAQLAEPLHVQTIDAIDAPGADGFRSLGGWECKIHAITGCPFEQVLLIDADNIPLFDPTIVFDSDQLRRYGQIFWPDFYYPPDHQFAIRPRAWKELNLPPRAGLELESGQMIIDRSKCWRELQIVRALNLDSVQCHRQLTWGDKDTFTLGWLLGRRPYCVVPQRPRHLRPQVSMLWQHWFDGRRLFQHQRKWIHPPDRARLELLEEELLKDESLSYLREFWQAADNRQSWGMKPVVKAVEERTRVPNMAEVLHLARQGNLSEAEIACRRLLKTKPTDAQVWHTLGLLTRDLHSFSEASHALARAVELAPDVVQYRIDLAMAFCNLNRAADAIPHLIHSLRLNGGAAKVQSTFGFVLEQMGRLQEAVGAYRNALLLQPTSVAAHIRLAKALRRASNPAESIEVFEKSIHLRSDSVIAYEGIAAGAEDLGDSERSISALRTAVKLRPQSPGLRSWLLYNLHYDPNMAPAELYREHLAWGAHVGQPCSAVRQDLEIRIDHGDRIRVGYLSPDFRDHTVPRFIGAALKHHDRGRFQVFCYSDVTHEDETTERLRGQVEHWRDTVGLDDQRMRQILQDDQIDILVDLRGHAAGNRMTLFSARAAPVQVNMVGYFDTTGLLAMDYRLTDQHQDPPGQTEQYHTEQLLRLGRSCWCYMADEDGPPVEPSPVQGNGYITFGSLNKLLKISEPCARLWAAVLEAVPDSKLLLPVGSAPAAETIQVRLQKAGIAGERIKLVERTFGRREYLQRFSQIDIALDTFPFNGITTSCDALWMGVPVVSLSGQTSVSRAGKSILDAVGLPQLAMASGDAFVRAAAELAQQVAALRALRLGMRERMLASPLMDHLGFTRDLEGAYAHIWNNRDLKMKAL